MKGCCACTIRERPNVDLHRVELLGEASIEAIEDVHEHVGDHVHGLVVVLFDRHLHVQPHELRQMAVGVGVLRSEHGADLEHALEISARRRHLLVQLRRLRQTRLRSEIVQSTPHSPAPPSLEHVRSALRGAGIDLRRVDLHEVVLQQILAEQQAHRAAQTDDRLVARRSQVDPAVVQTGIGVHRDELAVLLVQRLVRGDLRVGTHRRVQLEGQLDLHAGHDEHFLHGELHVLEGRRLDGRFHLLDDSVDIDDALLGDFARVVHHRLRNRAALEQTALHGVDVLAEDDEAALALVVDVEGAATDQHFLADVVLNFLQTTDYAPLEILRSPLFLGALSRLAERIVSKHIVGRHNARLRAALLLGSLQLSEILLRGSSLLNTQQRIQTVLPSYPFASSPFPEAQGTSGAARREPPFP